MNLHIASNVAGIGVKADRLLCILILKGTQFIYNRVYHHGIMVRLFLVNFVPKK